MVINITIKIVVFPNEEVLNSQRKNTIDIMIYYKSSDFTLSKSKYIFFNNVITI